MEEFRTLQRLDYLASSDHADPQLRFDRLFPGDRGHMFGVLECLSPGGNTVVLRAFSSLNEGIRNVPGWAPSPLSQELWDDMIVPEQMRIKELSRELQSWPGGSAEYQAVRDKRRVLSRELVRRVQGHYRFKSFRGDERRLAEAYCFNQKIPGGVGECCAPKLLQEAIRCGLKPVGMAEFYWGGSSKSGDKRQGRFYSCCVQRCQPILGFILCGLEGQ